VSGLSATLREQAVDRIRLLQSNPAGDRRSSR
jgi:hypothetical protein